MIKPLGDCALLMEMGGQISAPVNQRVHALHALLQAGQKSGFVESVPAYCTLLVEYDPLVLSYQEASEWVRGLAARVDTSFTRTARRVEVPVQYGGASGPDLDSVAATKGISPDEVIRLHSEPEYVVYMMGFTPGFPYLGILDERLHMPRRDSPRVHVPAGSVAIAAEQTGIYPIESPGGWHLIGQTKLTLFEPLSDSPFLFAPGDRVKFIPDA